MNSISSAISSLASSASSGTAPNLSAIVDDTTGKYTDAQKTLAFQERQARDSAFIIPASQQGIATGNGTLVWRAALTLLNSLSPAEQNSPRYAGTRQEIMLAISTNDGPSPWKSGPPDVEQIQWGSPSSVDAKAAAKESADWLKWIKGEIQVASTATTASKKVITPSNAAVAYTTQATSTTESSIGKPPAQTIDQTV